MRPLFNIPLVALDDLAAEGGIAVIAPHPDDETLGCGGLMALCAASRRDVTVLSVTDGGGSHPRSSRFTAPDIAAIRSRELRASLAVLGLSDLAIVALGRPDGDLGKDSVAGLADEFTDILAARGIKTVFATSRHDPHLDHQVVSSAAWIAALRLGARLWSYPIRSHVVESALLRPDDLVRLPISAVLDRKKAAIACHASQLAGWREDDTGFCLTASDIQAHTQPFELFERAPAAPPGGSDAAPAMVKA